MVYRESSANDHLRDNYPNLELEIESAEEVFGLW